jgi:hypothetical protein
MDSWSKDAGGRTTDILAEKDVSITTFWTDLENYFRVKWPSSNGRYLSKAQQRISVRTFKKVHKMPQTEKRKHNVTECSGKTLQGSDCNLEPVTNRKLKDR